LQLVGLSPVIERRKLSARASATRWLAHTSIVALCSVRSQLFGHIAMPLSSNDKALASQDSRKLDQA
jgi:hypothetical protein